MIKRHYIPGEQWAYFKIYAGNSTSEEILIKEIKDVLENVIQSKLVSQFFFVRYADPCFHLRLRFKLNDISYFSNIVSCINEALHRRVVNGSITKIQIDTYSRELERYGESMIETTEELFWIDSMAIMDILPIISQTYFDENRWILALLLIDSYLKAFEYSNKQKAIFCYSLFEHYKKEYLPNIEAIRKINKIFRTNKDSIVHILSRNVNDQILDKVICIAEQMSININKLYKRNKAIYKEYDIDYLLAQYIHMMLNRYFSAKARDHELILYSLLHKYYIYREHTDEVDHT